MEPPPSTGFDDARRRTEEHIQRNLERRQELAEILARFHERAAQQPDLWRDPVEAPKALRAAQELQDIDHETHLVYYHQLRREENARGLAAAGTAAGAAHPAPPMNPARRLRVEAFWAREAVDAVVQRLRKLDPSDPVLRQVDDNRRARLRWLLSVLTDVQPGAAQEIQRTWEQLRARGADQPGPRIERWERRTGDWLVHFLEPLLSE